MNFFPVDLKSATSGFKEGKRTTWPVTAPEFISLMRGQARTIFDFVMAMDTDSDMSNWILASQNVAKIAQNLTAATVFAQETKALALPVDGNSEAFHLICHGANYADYSLSEEKVARRRREVGRYLGVRNFRLTAKLNGLATPLAYLPDAPRAFSLSSAIERCMKFRKTPLQFCYFDSLIGSVLDSRTPNEPSPRLAGQARALISKLASIDLFCPAYQELLSEAMAPSIMKNLAMMEQDFSVVSKRKLPKEVWISPAGVYAQRLLAQAIRTQGGIVDIILHAGPVELLSEFDLSDIMIESVVGNRNTWPTEDAIRVAADNGMLDRAAAFSNTEHFALDGDATFGVFSQIPARPARNRPKVLYLGVIFLNDEQIFPGHLPDGMYFDWQIRLAEVLRSLPIDLVVRPHPDPRANGYEQYLELIGATSDGRLEQAVADADVVVSDNIRSTSFLQAACAPRNLVFLNLLGEVFSQALKDVLKTRCQIVEPEYDKDGRAYVEPDTLREVIFSEGQAEDARRELVRIFAGNAN